MHHSSRGKVADAEIGPLLEREVERCEWGEIVLLGNEHSKERDTDRTGTQQFNAGMIEKSRVLVTARFVFDGRACPDEQSSSGAAGCKA